jgi:hypothetical protein
LRLDSQPKLALLVRLKELETIEKIAEKVDKITVGSFDALIGELVTMRSAK